MNDLSTRQNEIVTLARSSGRVAVDDLARRYEVSTQTIRKDLNELCDRHLLSRVHGGAIIASGVENIAYEARRLVAAAEKRAIGAAAAGLIPNNSSLFISSGTTTEEVANGLANREDFVITNNIHVAMLLYPRPRIEVIVAGGSLGAPTAAPSARRRSDWFGSSRSTTRSSEPPRSRAMERFSTLTIRKCKSPSPFLKMRATMLVADSSKLRRSAPVRIAHIGQVQTWVTDGLGNSAVRDVCRERGVRLIEAAPQSASDDDVGVAHT